MASKYGVNMAHVENTISNLKTAKLKQDKLQSDLDTTGMEEEAYGNYLTKNKKSAVVDAVDENNDGIVDANEKKNALRMTGKKWGAIKDLRATDEKTANAKNIISNRNARTGISQGHLKLAQARENRAVKKQKDADAKEIKNTKNLENYLIANGTAPVMAKQIAEIGLKNTKDAQAVIDKGDATAKRQVIDGYTKGIAYIGSLIDTAVDDPQGTETRYQKSISDLKKAETDMLRAGNKEEADKIKEKYESMPTSILGKDGVIDTDYLQTKLMQTASTIERLESYEPQDKDKKLTFSQKKTHLREVRKVAKDILEEDYDLDPKQVAKIQEEAVKIAQANNKITAEEAVSKAKEKVLKLKKSVSAGNKLVPKRGQKSNDGKKIFDGKKWVEYKKK